MNVRSGLPVDLFVRRKAVVLSILVWAGPAAAEGDANKEDAVAEEKKADEDEKKKDVKEKPKEDDSHEGWWKYCSYPGPPGEDGKAWAKIATGCSVSGLRIAFTGLDIPNQGIDAGVMFHGQGEEFVRWGIVSVHGSHRSGIGGGGAGFEGELGGSLTLGIRAPVGRRHGPFIRAGIAGHLLGNDLFYSSLLELPRGEMGYQYMSGITVLEAAVTTGFAIDGRYGQRIPPTIGYSPLTPLSGFAFGGYLAVQLPHMRLGVGVQGVPASEGAPRNVYTGQAIACAVGFVLALCFDMRTMSEDGLAPFGHPAHATYYGGITFGFSRER